MALVSQAPHMTISWRQEYKSLKKVEIIGVDENSPVKATARVGLILEGTLGQKLAVGQVLQKLYLYFLLPIHHPTTTPCSLNQRNVCSALSIFKNFSNYFVPSTAGGS